MKALSFDAYRYGYWTPRRRMALARLFVLVVPWAVVIAGTILAIQGATAALS